MTCSGTIGNPTAKYCAGTRPDFGPLKAHCSERAGGIGTDCAGLSGNGVIAPDHEEAVLSNAIRHDARFVSTGSKPAIVPLGYNLMLQIRELRFHIASLLAFGVTVLGGVIVIARRKHVPIAILTRDPPASLNYHSYTGALSYLGIIIWAGCAAICLFTGWAMRN